MPGEGESVGTFRGLETAIEQLHSRDHRRRYRASRSSSVTRARRSERCSTRSKYPVRGIVNVDALLDTTDFSGAATCTRTAASQRRYPRRSGRSSSPACIPNGLAPPAKQCCGASISATARGHAGLLGAGARDATYGRDAIWPTRSRTCAPSRFRTRWCWVRSLTPRHRAWMAEHFPEANVVAIREQRALPARRHPDAFARLLARTAP